VPNSDLDRRLVSFQANRNTPFHSWFKYREGFSTGLVRYAVEHCGRGHGLLLDPFAGSGTALFESRSLGWDSIGVELLPVGPFIVETRLAAETVDPSDFQRYVDSVHGLDLDSYFDPRFRFPHIPITEGAFSERTERALAGYRAYCQRHITDPQMRKLFDFAAFCVLESVSFTRKDGQYLRWDQRAGKDRVKSHFDKGPVPEFAVAVRTKLREMAEDISESRHAQDLFDQPATNQRASIDLRKGSCLDVLPRMRASSVDLIVTSPPYCNRYDYTRTYCLELVYLGFDAVQVSALRQQLLSSTVENRAKASDIEAAYAGRKDKKTFDAIREAFQQQRALHEVLDILYTLSKNKDLNNLNIPRMVENYFFEMCVMVCEMARVLRKGGMVMMVNDNVRYAGEEVPVDLILSDFAESFGLRVKHIWALPRGKGNSSQQMGQHGRSELRKCVYVWRKE
jgi:DNA modification methylase